MRERYAGKGAVSMNFVSIDFETANSSRSSICSVGIVEYERGEIVNEYYELVKPKDRYFHPINTSIHGITYEDVKHKEEFSALWPAMKSMLENKLVLAHNAAFDMSCLRYVLDENNVPYPTISYNCTVNIAKAVWPGLPNYKLTNLSQQLGFALNHHNALEDARACGNILIEAVKRSHANDLQSFCDAYSITHGSLFPGGYQTPRARKKVR